MMMMMVMVMVMMMMMMMMMIMIMMITFRVQQRFPHVFFWWFPFLDVCWMMFIAPKIARKMIPNYDLQILRLFPLGGKRTPTSKRNVRSSSVLVQKNRFFPQKWQHPPENVVAQPNKQTNKPTNRQTNQPTNQPKHSSTHTAGGFPFFCQVLLLCSCLCGCPSNCQLGGGWGLGVGG